MADTVNIADLPVGHVFPTFQVPVTRTSAEAYISATGGGASNNPFSNGVHPLQLDAAAIAELIRRLGIVENRIETVHAGQQMSVGRPLVPGENAYCTSTLTSNSVRRGARWATVKSVFQDSSGATVAESLSTLILVDSAQ